MDGEIAVAVVAAASPGVHGEPETALDVSGSFVAALVPVLLPSHHFVGDGELFAIGLGARAGDVEIAGDELQRVHLQLSGQVFDGSHGDERGLGMIGCAPGTGASLVGGDGRVLLALIRDVEDVGQRRSCASAYAASSPGARIPGDEFAVLVGGDLDARVGRGTHAGDLEFGAAVEHVLDRLASRGLGKIGGVDVPAVSGKLAAESAADIFLQHVDAARGNVEGLGHLGRDTRNVLGGDVDDEFLVAGPFAGGTVGLHAGVHNAGDAVNAFDHRVRRGECLVGSPRGLQPGLFVWRF